MSEKPDDDLEGFKECLNAIAEYAENSKVFVLVHKMDLLEEDNGHPPGHKQERFEAKCHELKEIADEHKIQVFFKNWINFLNFIDRLLENVNLGQDALFRLV